MVGAVVAPRVLLVVVVASRVPATGAASRYRIAHAQAAPEVHGRRPRAAAPNAMATRLPRADFPKMNENIVWQQKDKHAKAYDTLTNERLKSGREPVRRSPRSSSIAKAETSDRCLVCHAVNAKPELRGPKFDIAEGVHCEGCHGPAEKWLESHAEKGWTHEQSVKLGMYDTAESPRCAPRTVCPATWPSTPTWWRPGIPTCWLLSWTHSRGT